MLAVVVAMFATLWLPYRSYVVYNSFARRRYENRWFLLFCRLAVYANSAVNPILYNAMSAKFRSAFRAQLACCCCCCRKYSRQINPFMQRLKQTALRRGNTSATPPNRAYLTPHYTRCLRKGTLNSKSPTNLKSACV